ncbi:putative amidohydrolase [Actinoalloteichus hoggarensis]|uniref:(R)-stereoselective amidase n=1 Tax=Actinoalloteichus hoggarensis TaxID=1470176 RepID=A0A221VWP3_9PSEU|nr:carbon-nitrogen hydrolase family protein [Actinoalloteichus hoggarensis]ASO17924.1 (R)-stereoselective amidase [Actinoalloteichus hoggarensis]MBB5924335.1 putative amidohydrolase [Actinoalloteichus hoggarensis]
MRIALSQLAADTDPQVNLGSVRTAVTDAAAQGARVLLLPEATMARFGIPLGPVAEPLDGPWATAVRAAAKAADVVVVAGMFVPADDGRVRNTLLITGPGVDTAYDKVHLFDAFGFAESDTVAPGERPVTFTVDSVTFGVATCYDLRFPGLFHALADDGAQVMLVGASWGAGPGKREQWELLCRARALDSTSWLLACGQADPSTIGERPKGAAPTGIGYSSLVSPVGEIRAQLGPAPGLLPVDVDIAEVERARETIPVLANRRF